MPAPVVAEADAGLAAALTVAGILRKGSRRGRLGRWLNRKVRYAAGHVSGFRYQVSGAARDLEQAALQVSGVEVLHSHLRISPIRPQPAPRSTARRRLEATVRTFGIAEEGAVKRIIGGVLARFLDRVPEAEREHVLTHLPSDVRELMPATTPSGRIHDLRGFFAAVADTIWLPDHDAEMLTRALLDELRVLVPEEVDDVDATLPSEMKPLWEQPSATS